MKVSENLTLEQVKKVIVFDVCKIVCDFNAKTIISFVFVLCNKSHAYSLMSGMILINKINILIAY